MVSVVVVVGAVVVVLPPSPPLPVVVPPWPTLASPPHPVSETVAPKAKAAARPRRRGAEGTARRARSLGSAAAQKGQLSCVVRTWRSQAGQGTSGWYTRASEEKDVWSLSEPLPRAQAHLSGAFCLVLGEGLDDELEAAVVEGLAPGGHGAHDPLALALAQQLQGAVVAEGVVARLAEERRGWSTSSRRGRCRRSSRSWQ